MIFPSIVENTLSMERHDLVGKLESAMFWRISNLQTEPQRRTLEELK